MLKLKTSFVVIKLNALCLTLTSIELKIDKKIYNKNNSW